VRKLRVRGSVISRLMARSIQSVSSARFIGRST